MTLLGDDLYSRQSICELALKQGYNFIFVAKESSHQLKEKNLAEILLTLNLTAFLFHNVLELGNEIYQKIRSKLGTRKTFFNDMRALY
jgi:hypothetical protein